MLHDPDFSNEIIGAVAQAWSSNMEIEYHRNDYPSMRDKIPFVSERLTPSVSRKMATLFVPHKVPVGFEKRKWAGGTPVYCLAPVMKYVNSLIFSPVNDALRVDHLASQASTRF